MGVFSEVSIDMEYDREMQEDGDRGDLSVAIESTAGTIQKIEEPPKEKKVTAENAANKISDKDARAAHDAAEKERKERWEAAQREKEAMINKRLQEIAAIDEESAIHQSIQLVDTQGERITRRNMKMCVIEYLKDYSRQHPDFAKKLLNPRKNLINCFRYITRHACEYIRKEMETDIGFALNQDIKCGYEYGEDVPDDLCYQWAIDYVNDPDAKEDKEPKEIFKPKPYTGTKQSKKKTPVNKGKSLQKPEDSKQDDLPGQMSFFNVNNFQEKAG